MSRQRCFLFFLTMLTSALGSGSCSDEGLTGNRDPSNTRGVISTTHSGQRIYRTLEYNHDSGNFYFIGEKWHGLWLLNSGGNKFWWCRVGHISQAKEAWSKAIKSQQNNDPIDLEVLGLQLPYSDSEQYNVLRLYPIAGKTKVFTNSIEGEISVADYLELETKGLANYFLYENKNNGNLFIAAVLPNRILPSDPPGVAAGQLDFHGFTCPMATWGAKCDGVLIDIAFMAYLTFGDTNR